MLERERAVGRVVEERVVHGRVTGGVELVDAGDEPDPVLARDRAETVCRRPRDLHRGAASAANAAFARGSFQPASARAREEEGYTETNVSGNTTRSAPLPAPRPERRYLVERRVAIGDAGSA